MHPNPAFYVGSGDVNPGLLHACMANSLLTEHLLISFLLVAMSRFCQKCCFWPHSPSFSTLLAVTKLFGMTLVRKLLLAEAQCMDTGAFLWVAFLGGIFYSCIVVKALLVLRVNPMKFGVFEWLDEPTYGEQGSWGHQLVSVWLSWLSWLKVTCISYSLSVTCVLDCGLR